MRIESFIGVRNAFGIKQILMKLLSIDLRYEISMQISAKNKIDQQEATHIACILIKTKTIVQCKT
jgi:hypothetical protein